jgi:hypothetical protein
MEAAMTGIRFFNIHRPWEDWVGVFVGVLIGLSPWLTAQQHNQSVIWNAVLVGALALGLALAQLANVSRQRWEEIGEIACGLWLIASPFIFDYAKSGTLRSWHFFLGAILVLIATLELWQDWTQSDQELARHRH